MPDVYGHAPTGLQASGTFIGEDIDPFPPTSDVFSEYMSHLHHILSYELLYSF
jgi:hypothetical protein